MTHFRSVRFPKLLIALVALLALSVLPGVGEAFTAKLSASAGAGAAPPKPTLKGAPPTYTAAGAQKITWDSSKTLTYECQVDGGAVARCESPQERTGLTEVAHSLKVRAKDRAGKFSGWAIASWTVDKTKPGQPSITTKPLALSNSATPTFEWSAAPDLSPVTYLCKLDQGKEVDCPSPKNLTGVKEGSHKFTVRAKDAAGNVGDPVEVSWDVDLTRPVKPQITRPIQGVVGETVLDIRFDKGVDLDPETKLRCQIDDLPEEDCSSPLSDDMRTKLGDKADESLDGKHVIKIWQVDKAGNKSEPVTARWVIDVAARDATFGPVTRNAPRPSITFAGESEGEAGNGSGGNRGFQCSFDSGTPVPCTSPYKVSTNLEDGSTHTLEVSYVSYKGHRSKPTKKTWLVDLTKPKAPTITKLEFKRSTDKAVSNSTMVQFGGLEQGATAQCSLDAGPFKDCPTSGLFSASRLSMGNHSIAVRQTDSAGNKGTAVTKTFVVSGASCGRSFADGGRYRASYTVNNEKCAQARALHLKLNAKTDFPPGSLPSGNGKRGIPFNAFFGYRCWIRNIADRGQAYILTCSRKSDSVVITRKL